MIMTVLLSDKNLFTKTITNLKKLSTCMFQRRMRESGSKTCEIERLDGTSTKTRSTLFLEDTWKTQAFTRRIRPNECRTNSR
jgi:hypothetical protein